MNKPVLLLVDDDRAVLEALEAELAPVFAELCRIEAFDDARAVLEALPRWADERRSIAVAIVDQKMPGMTGVELLAALRVSVEQAGSTAFTPARHTRAILLTGYAGLDSAMAAKNDGGVERYLEKPWTNEGLRGEVRLQLGEYSNLSGAGVHYVFREPQKDAELIDLLRLRRAVYDRTPDLRDLLPQASEEGLDASPFDCYSRHMMVGEVLNNGLKVNGCLRIATGRREQTAALFDKLGESYPTLREAWRAAPPFPLPLLSDFPELAASLEPLGVWATRVVEPGRLCVDVRAGGLHAGRGRLARFLIEVAIAYFFIHLESHSAVLGCVAAHATFYRRYGFQNAPGVWPRPHPRLGIEFAILIGRNGAIPEVPRTRCEEIAARARRTVACLCEGYPHCLGGPYATGDFREVDLWCPVLAQERLMPRAPIQGVA